MEKWSTESLHKVANFPTAGYAYSGMFILAVIYFGAGALLYAIGLPLARRRIKPNPWYGFRTVRTLKDPNIWYPANAFVGTKLVRFGMCLMASSVACTFVPDVTEVAYAIGLTGLLLIGVAMITIQGFQFLAKLPVEPPTQG